MFGWFVWQGQFSLPGWNVFQHLVPTVWLWFSDPATECYIPSFCCCRCAAGGLENIAHFYAQSIRYEHDQIVSWLERIDRIFPVWKIGVFEEGLGGYYGLIMSSEVLETCWYVEVWILYGSGRHVEFVDVCYYDHGSIIVSFQIIENTVHFFG